MCWSRRARRATRIDAGADNPFLRYRRWLTPYRLARARRPRRRRLGRTGRRTRRAAEGGRRPRLPRHADGAPAGARRGARPRRRPVDQGRDRQRLRLAQGPPSDGRDALSARPRSAPACRSARTCGRGGWRSPPAATRRSPPRSIARAADWPLDVFIPADAEPGVVRRLERARRGGRRLRAARRRGRRPLRARRARAVAAGAIPFGVQGPDNGLAVEGGRTLAFEMAETLARGRRGRRAVRAGRRRRACERARARLRHRGRRRAAAPRAAPDRGADRRLRAARARLGALDGVDLGEAARNRSRFMWPWETRPGEPRPRHPRRRDLRLAGDRQGDARHRRRGGRRRRSGGRAGARTWRAHIPPFRSRRPARRASPAR